MLLQEHFHLCSETMHLNLVFISQPNICEKFTNVVSLVALKLNNFSVLWMIHYCSIAGELLFKSFHQLFLIVVL